MVKFYSFNVSSSTRMWFLSGVMAVSVVASAWSWSVVHAAGENTTKPKNSGAGPADKAPSKSVGDKPAAAKDGPTLLDLSPYVKLKAADFDKTKRFPWKVVPHGAQTYANVPVQIDGAIFLYGESNAKIGLKYPEELTGIQVKQKFETLYVYHTVFFEGEKGSAVYEIVFHYADQTSASDKIVCGDDVRDWYVNPDDKMPAPTGKRSALGWQGEFVSDGAKQPLRFCLTAIENPHPKLEVVTIDLVSAKSKTAGCVLAMTAGKSGLMRRPTDDKPKTEAPQATTK